jgi:hypothetical protein
VALEPETSVRNEVGASHDCFFGTGSRMVLFMGISLIMVLWQLWTTIPFSNLEEAMGKVFECA